MGCSISKDTESPQKGHKKISSWDRVIHGRFTLQISRSFKAINGSYMAAIFSANYGTLRKRGPFKALERKVSLSHAAEKEIYPMHKRNTVIESDANARPNMISDTVGVPMVSTKCASELLEVQAPNGSTTGNLHTIDILELMEGLAEEEVSLSFDDWQPGQESSILSPVNNQGHVMVSSGKSTIKECISEAFSDKNTSRARPNSFSSIDSIRSVEDVDLAFSALNRMKLLPSKSFSEVWQQEKVADVEGCLSTAKFLGTIFNAVIKQQDEDGNVVASVPVCRDTTSVGTTEDASTGNPERLQTALSFKYMLNHRSCEKQSLLPDAQNSQQIDEVNWSESLVFAPVPSLYANEGNSAPSSPEFSAAASLKDWLPSSNHLSKPLEDLVCGYEIPGPDPLRSMEYQDEPKVQSCRAPVFDPEMVDSFENAMRHLSKEEWDAVRGMEDSPQNFLRLVKALRKSSSNSVRNQEEKGLDLSIISTNKNGGMDTNGCFKSKKPLGCKPEKVIIERMQAFMRQNSLEVRTTSSKPRPKSNKGRASVVFYSTTQDGSKAFEDCGQVRSILKSLVGIWYEERSISELAQHQWELRHALNVSVLIVPTLYVQGKYLVGIESILHLYKKGKLGSILEEAVALEPKTTVPSSCVCRESEILVCPLCKGGHRLSRVGEGTHM